TKRAVIEARIRVNKTCMTVPIRTNRPGCSRQFFDPASAESSLIQALVSMAIGPGSGNGIKPLAIERPFATPAPRALLRGIAYPVRGGHALPLQSGGEFGPRSILAGIPTRRRDRFSRAPRFHRDRQHQNLAQLAPSELTA